MVRGRKEWQITEGFTEYSTSRAAPQRWTGLATDAHSVTRGTVRSCTLPVILRMMLGASLGIGILTALAMFALTFVLPRGTAMRDAVLVQFPMTVGVWAIFSFALCEIEVGSSVQVNGPGQEHSRLPKLSFG
jgi:hypothetical protein